MQICKVHIFVLYTTQNISSWRRCLFLLLRTSCRYFWGNLRADENLLYPLVSFLLGHHCYTYLQSYYLFINWQYIYIAVIVGTELLYDAYFSGSLFFASSIFSTAKLCSFSDLQGLIIIIQALPFCCDYSIFTFSTIASKAICTSQSAMDYAWES